MTKLKSYLQIVPSFVQSRRGFALNAQCGKPKEGISAPRTQTPSANASWCCPQTSGGHGVLRKGQHGREDGINHIHPAAGWATSRFLVEVCYVRQEFCSALLSLQTQRSAWGLDVNEDLRGMDLLSESCTGFPVGGKDRIPPGHSHQWHQVMPLSSALLSWYRSVWPSQAVPNALLWAEPPAAPCQKDWLNDWCLCSQHFIENSKATTWRSKEEDAKIQY